MKDFDDIAHYRDMKEQIRRSMGQGMHLFDAATEAGLSLQLVIANMASDRDFKEWFEASRNRVRLRATPVPENLTQRDVQEAYRRAMIRAGAVEKVAMVVALADPTTPEGKRDLKNFALQGLRDSMSNTVPDDSKKEKLPALTASDAKEMIEANAQAIEEYRKQVSEAEGVYDQGEDEPDSAGADSTED